MLNVALPVSYAVSMTRAERTAEEKLISLMTRAKFMGTEWRNGYTNGVVIPQHT